MMLLIWLLMTGCSNAKVEHKASGKTESEVIITQDICTVDNGFITAGERKQCILCMQSPALCPTCEKYAVSP